MFPLWSLKATRFPVAEINYPNRSMEYYIIKLINNEWFIIKDVGVFRIQDGVAKILDGKVRIYQYFVQAKNVNPISPNTLKGIHSFCRKNKFKELLPLMLEKDNNLEIHEPMDEMTSQSLHQFKSVDPTHVYQFYEQMDQLHEESKKWMTKKVFPKIEAKTIFMILVGGAVAIAIIVPTVANNSGSLDMDFFIPKFLKGEGGEFILGLKMFMQNLLVGLFR